MFVSRARWGVILTAAVLACGLAGQSHAQWSLSWLGQLNGDEASWPGGISHDGLVIAGESIFGDYHTDQHREAFRFTESSGMVGLGFLPEHAWSEAHGLSADGSVVVGYSQPATGEHMHSGGQAFRWTEAEGMTGLGYLPGDDQSWAFAVSANGRVVVGQSGDWEGNAFRWTESDGMVDLGVPEGGAWSRATAVSADGSMIFGEWGTETTWEGGFRWTEGAGIVRLGTSRGEMSYLHDVSADGSVVVGESDDWGAVRWTEQTGVVPLADASQFDHAAALGVSADGSLIVGHGDQLRPFLWDAENALRDLSELLAADGVQFGEGYLQSARDVFFDGRTIIIVGEGIDPTGAGLQTWMARYVIPEPSSVVALLSMALVGLTVGLCRRLHPAAGRAAATREGLANSQSHHRSRAIVAGGHGPGDATPRRRPRARRGSTADRETPR